MVLLADARGAHEAAELHRCSRWRGGGHERVTPMNPNKALWKKGDFTRIAESMRENGEALGKGLGIAKRVTFNGPDHCAGRSFMARCLPAFRAGVLRTRLKL
jgi:hypothetical protein